MQLAGKLKNFIENWKTLTNNTEVLSLVEVYSIPLSSTEKHPKFSKIMSGNKIIVQKVHHEMLNKGTIVKTPNHLEWEFIRNHFLVEKKIWGKPTSNKLEIPKLVRALPALQDGGFALSLKHSKEGRLCVQTGFEGRILFSSIKFCIQKVCSVFLVRETLQVSLSLFWTKPSTKNFYKITQTPSFSITSPEILIIIYLGNMFLIGHIIEETLLPRDTVIFLFPQLRFVVNLKKPVLTPTQRIELLVVAVESLIVTLSLPDKIVSRVQKQCLELLQN